MRGPEQATDRQAERVLLRDDVRLMAERRIENAALAPVFGPDHRHIHHAVLQVRPADTLRREARVASVRIAGSMCI